MTSRDLIIFCAFGAVIASCDSNKKSVETAKHSLYDIDFATVYSAVMDVTRAEYPTLQDNPGNGKIATAWHQVQYSNEAQGDMPGLTSAPVSPAQGFNPNSGQPIGSTGVSPAANAGGMPTRIATKKYYIRFDINIMGGRPWRVKVIGHASEWDPGMANPTELHGPARPHWLEGRTDALQLKIYKKIHQYAIPMKEETGNTEDELPKTDPTSFKGVPEGAGKRLAAIKDALAKRDYAAIGAELDIDIVWSLGGGTGADTAMAMWQADPAAFDAMAAAITAGCVEVEPGKRVTCPGGAATPGVFQLVLEPRGDTWKVTSFVKAE